ncbi:class I SAM-dependent methyltransferase [Ferrovibrio xuzhouensis]|uniref:Class I SAM-dependent methyltransferase n=1 Tax=Ferrovibrio xuzhouensis TaxID=1576914 RepID=A0ABV7V9A2_9PROT
MSRLDSFIRRLEAQRSLLDWAAASIGDRPGLVLEVGLGNGRTYDHLRQKLPGRDIYAFDRANNANPASVPPPDRLLLGDFFDTLPEFARQRPGQAVLIHADAGLGDPAANVIQVRKVAAMVPALAASGAIILSDQRFEHPDLLLQDAPVPIPPNRYYVFIRK